jgi:hypothetical protein
MIAWTAALLFVACAAGAALAADEPAAGLPDAKEKQGPNEGQFEITISTDGDTKTYDAPGKAVSLLRRAVSAQKRAPEGEEPLFSAVITLNGTGYEFTDAAAAQYACQVVTQAARQLSAIRMGLGDIGPLPEIDPELAAEKLQEGMKPTPAQAMMIVRQRIMAAMNQEMAQSLLPSGRGGSAQVRVPDPRQMQAMQQRMNQIAQQEIQKAQAEGLLPAGPVAVQGDPVANQKEAVIQMLALAFSKGTLVEAAATKDEPEVKEEAKEE